MVTVKATNDLNSDFQFTMDQDAPIILQRVSLSLLSLGALLSRSRATFWTVIALLTIHTGMLAYSGYVHSPTYNEPGHLVAGLSHWKFGRFELYRVNPPLVRMVAAIPVIVAGYEENWSQFYESPGGRPVSHMGKDFVAANGEQSFFLFTLARWACIPFSWIGAIVCYLWARDLYGKPAGLVACTMWCFSPSILAHASLITADAGGTALGVAACYTFWRWLKQPTWGQAALTGVVLGLAELAKTTLILFYPLWPLIWVAYRWSDRHKICFTDWLREAGMLLLRLAIGLYVMNAGYGFEGSLKPLGEFQFVSDLFTGRFEQLNASTNNAQAETDISRPGNRFAGSWLGRMRVPFPRNYLVGIDIQQKDFEDIGRPSYLRGNRQEHGWWYYYLYAAAIKVPLGTLLLGVAAGLAYCFKAKNNRRSRKQLRDSLLVIAPPLVIFSVCSMKTGFSEHFRYVLPCFPFMFIFIGSIVQLPPQERESNSFDKSGIFGRFNRGVGFSALQRHISVLIAFLITWSVASSLWIFPHSLSYFNEAIGGPLNGPKHLLGSTVDWGQDLLYVKRWVESHETDGTLHLAYHGFFDPSVADFPDVKPFPNSTKKTTGVNEDNFFLEPGLYAISINIKWGYYSRASDGKYWEGSVDSQVLRAITKECVPVSVGGYSIEAFIVPPVLVSVEKGLE